MNFLKNAWMSKKKIKTINEDNIRSLDRTVLLNDC